jgi:hypothetical protein
MLHCWLFLTIAHFLKNVFFLNNSVLLELFAKTLCTLRVLQKPWASSAFLKIFVLSSKTLHISHFPQNLCASCAFLKTLWFAQNLHALLKNLAHLLSSC